jgi:hypothetical protein
MSMLRQALHEPLIHFLSLGAILFLVSGYLAPAAERLDPRTIVVDRNNLLDFLQNRARSFDQAGFEAYLDGLADEQLDEVVTRFVREEALFREAKALRLDQNDYVGKMRLVQQLEYITRGFADRQVTATEDKIEAYYAEHRLDYYVQPEVTFTHVFFSKDVRGFDAAKQLALTELAALNRQRVPFEEATRHGDRFLYHANYVNKATAEIASHFGELMQMGVFALSPDDAVWQGPFESPYGFHLVLLPRSVAGYQPTLAEVRPNVEQAVLRQLEEDQYQAAIATIVSAYHVRQMPIRTQP